MSESTGGCVPAEAGGGASSTVPAPSLPKARNEASRNGRPVATSWRGDARYFGIHHSLGYFVDGGNHRGGEAA